MPRIMYGTREDLTVVADVPLSGPNGEDLQIAYKTTSYVLGAGVYIKDDGYVLAIKGQYGSYFAMPAGKELTAFQAAGQLPAQLPDYSLTWGQYAMGYSLWIALAAWGVYAAVKYAVTRRRTAPVVAAGVRTAQA
jgi:hypothetical protein